MADVILQKEGNAIEIEGRKYEMAPPSSATIILVSAMVSQMPIVNKDTDNILFEVLKTAKDTDIVGRIAATLILGAKRIREGHTVTIATKRRWSWKKMRWIEETTTMPEEEYIARVILEEVAPKTLVDAISERLLDMQVADFFALTTSLSVINITKRTREVEATATASGE